MSWPPPALDVTPALSAADVLLACEVMLEAGEWLASCGQPLWNHEELAPRNVVPSPNEGTLFLARLAGRAVGSYVLLFEDPLVWPDVPLGEANYVRKLAIRRSVAGTGISRGLLEHATGKARADGRPFLRLDCVPRPKLRAFYESLGFCYHSECTVDGSILCRYQIATRPAP
jgi:GNAT superfamily N-acetyltransferase